MVDVVAGLLLRGGKVLLGRGESPESGSHLPHGHEYVDPRSVK